MNHKLNVDSEEIAKFSQYAQVWWDKDGPLKTLHDINPARIAFILKTCPLANKQVLDVGCGGGILTEAMASQDATVTGLDLSEEALSAAREHALSKHLTINYVCSAIEDYDEAQFDVITCMEMLEHVPQPEVIINHCARLLRPGGYLFLSTINRTFKAYTSVILAAEYLLGILPRQTHDFEKFVKPSELAQMARAAGLEMLKVSGMSYNPFSRSADLRVSVDVNYLLCCRKPDDVNSI
ncbi:bifunctional 2-polyprenyl-6-hydroxyphenol methylase/3-demethylubiquinol 3-O-methyltransferase UbiG [Legionella jordanis]|uniref:Ubiquinone biosynthesis O-methyltransferase n=1 Tax=Legionella jordanis TaxID=456 RepID=A0A0W0VA62_9GAMM|nr:bifunctional 2-polyprenyl-6-hydroxyphenol methylase/3-demethylubiquinol 3-O-methyltransferase UbiG [Legionella jordanis]KTD17022.1 3-demethylubiquinone-9 3-methyltransferase [Legionella jordanis]RMX03162.1 bifunctional 2-polyprenyl-6-hydroxyphenol methylase/3-demethylubiquinol 3-O-methyltransferase UbiG [Legionella jordanis]VEH12782.1 3-demethylubiquinone-9 3-methyltransferase [Legionella jordanis]HAT8713073.1 bifunctional 2-polyprenyl-6-hydroxyphenol methylase/3-demethylubiquinol 3-O-methyl